MMETEKKPIQEQECIVLKLPWMDDKEAFLKLTADIKKKGARFDRTDKSWYIRPGLKDQFKEFLPDADSKLPAPPNPFYKSPNAVTISLEIPDDPAKFDDTIKFFKENGASFDKKVKAGILIRI